MSKPYSDAEGKLATSCSQMSLISESWSKLTVTRSYRPKDSKSETYEQCLAVLVIVLNLVSKKLCFQTGEISLNFSRSEILIKINYLILPYISFNIMTVVLIVNVKYCQGNHIKHVCVHQENSDQAHCFLFG